MKKNKPTLKLALHKTSLRVLNESELTLVVGALVTRREQTGIDYQETRSIVCPENAPTVVNSTCITMTAAPLTERCPQRGGGQQH